MTLAEYNKLLLDWVALAREVPSGPALYRTIHTTYPELAGQITDTNVDPYDEPENTARCLDYIRSKVVKEPVDD